MTNWRSWLRAQLRWRSLALAVYLAAMVLLGPDLAAIVTFFTVLWMMIIYHLIYPWWSTEIGRNIMSLAACCEGFLSLRMMVLRFGEDYPGRDSIRSLMYALITVVFLVRIAIILRTTQDPAHDPAYRPDNDRAIIASERT